MARAKVNSTATRPVNTAPVAAKGARSASRGGRGSSKKRPVRKVGKPTSSGGTSVVFFNSKGQLKLATPEMVVAFDALFKAFEKL